MRPGRAAWAVGLLAAGAGAGNSVAASLDARAGHSHGPLTTRYQAGLLGLGLLGELVAWDQEVSETLLVVGTALIARRASFSFSVAPQPGT